MFTSSTVRVPFNDMDGLIKAVRDGTYRVCLEDSTALYATILVNCFIEI